VSESQRLQDREWRDDTKEILRKLEDLSLESTKERTELKEQLQALRESINRRLP